MTKHSRWDQAQSYEKKHWMSRSEKIKSSDFEDLTWYKWRAKNLLTNISKAFPSHRDFSFSQAKVLEIGSGPVGLISALEAAEKTAIDPLCNFYSTQEALIKYRSNDVKYINGKGEELPFDNSYLDLLIIENVIDHVQNSQHVLEEIARVIKPQGILYLTVNLHPPLGFCLHRILSNLRIDKGHPHTFTLNKIRLFIKQQGFEIVHDKWEDYTKCRLEDLKSNSIKNKLKAISGLSEFLYTCVCQKTS